MCERNKFGEEKQDPVSQQPLKRNSSRAVRIHLSTSPSKKTRGKTKKKYHAQLPAQVPTSSVANISLWHRKTGAKRQAKETGTIEKKVAEASVGTGEGRKNSAVFHNVWRQKAMVPGKVRTHCSTVRLAKRREGLGVQRLADLANLPHAG